MKFKVKLVIQKVFGKRKKTRVETCIVHVPEKVDIHDWVEAQKRFNQMKNLRTSILSIHEVIHEQ